MKSEVVKETLREIFTWLLCCLDPHYFRLLIMAIRPWWPGFCVCCASPCLLTLPPQPPGFRRSVCQLISLVSRVYERTIGHEHENTFNFISYFLYKVILTLRLLHFAWNSGFPLVDGTRVECNEIGQLKTKLKIIFCFPFWECLVVILCDARQDTD